MYAIGADVWYHSHSSGGQLWHTARVANCHWSLAPDPSSCLFNTRVLGPRWWIDVSPESLGSPGVDNCASPQPAPTATPQAPIPKPAPKHSVKRVLESGTDLWYTDLWCNPPPQEGEPSLHDPPPRGGGWPNKRGEIAGGGGGASWCQYYWSQLPLCVHGFPFPCVGRVASHVQQQKIKIKTRKPCRAKGKHTEF